jgi:hypothetical protein
LLRVFASAPFLSGRAYIVIPTRSKESAGFVIPNGSVESAGFVIPNVVRNLFFSFAAGVSFHGDKSLMGTTQSMYSG